MTEEDTQTSSTERAEERKRAGGRVGSKLALMLSLLALGALGTVLWLGYPHWQTMQQDMQRLQQSIQDNLQIEAELKASLESAHKLIRQSPTTEQLSEQRTAMVAQQQLLSKARTAMEQREVELRITIADLRKRTGKPDNRWMVAEAEYLLQLARLRLQFAGDMKTAIRAILQAEERLAETGDEQWIDIRQLLTADADKLDAITAPDLRQLSLSISVLVDQIPDLRPVFRSPEKAETKKEETAEPKDTTASASWQSLWQTLKMGASEAISIRRHDRMPETLITPAQEQLLYQNLELILETCRLALVQHDQDLFRANLQRAGNWIRNRFDLQHGTAESMLSKLDELMKIDLAPELPDITPTLEALQARKALLASQSGEALNRQ